MIRISVVICLFGSLLICPLVVAQDYDSLIQEALSLRNAGDMPAAEDRLREAYGLADNRSEVSYLLGMVVAFQQRFLEAREIIEQGLAEHPDYLELRIARARVMGFQGLFAAASEELENILAEHPGNPQVLNLQGRLNLYQGRYTTGSESFAAVLAQDPDNLEALVGSYDAAMALGNRRAAENSLSRAAEVAPGHVDVEIRLQRNSAVLDTEQHLLIGSVGGSNFDRPGFRDWVDRSLEYRRISSNGNQQFIRGEHAHRFGLHDSMLELGVVVSEGFALPFNISVGFADEKEFLPRHRFTIGSYFRESEFLGGSSIFNINYSQSRYRTGDTRSININMEHYITGQNFWLTPGIGLLEDEDGDRDPIWQMGIHGQFSPRWRAGLNYTDAPDTDNNITALTRTLHGYVAYQLNDALQLRVDLSRSRRVDVYDRDSINFSFTYRFNSSGN